MFTQSVNISKNHYGFVSIFLIIKWFLVYNRKFCIPHNVRRFFYNQLILYNCDLDEVFNAQLWA